jgi:hypothetical protein
MEVIGEFIAKIIGQFIIENIFGGIFLAIKSAIAWVYLRIRYRTQDERNAVLQAQSGGSLSFFCNHKNR